MTYLLNVIVVNVVSSCYLLIDKRGTGGIKFLLGEPSPYFMGTIFKSPKPRARYMAEEVP